jgi:hypothetical protein
MLKKITTLPRQARRQAIRFRRPRPAGGVMQMTDLDRTGGSRLGDEKTQMRKLRR